MRVNANALIIHDGSVLLARFEDKRGIYYTLPGGKIEKHESVLDAVKRECWEEAGVEVEVGELILTYDHIPVESEHGRFGKKRKIGLLFSAKLLSPPDQIRMIEPDDEQTGAEWVPIERLTEAAQSGNPLLYPRIERELIRHLEGQRTGPHFLSNS